MQLPGHWTSAVQQRLGGAVGWLLVDPDRPWWWMIWVFWPWIMSFPLECTDCLFNPKQWLVILWFNDCTISMQWDQSSKARSQAWSQKTSQTTFKFAWDWRKRRIPDWIRTWASCVVWNGISKRRLNDLSTLKTATQNCWFSDSPLRLRWLRERSRTMYLDKN